MNPKALAQKLMDVWNSHKENEVNNLISPNYVCHDPATPKDFGKGPEGFKQRFKMYNTAFPDSKFTVEEIFAEAPGWYEPSRRAQIRVMSRSPSFVARHMCGIPATGSRLR